MYWTHQNIIDEPLVELKEFNIINGLTKFLLPKIF